MISLLDNIPFLMKEIRGKKSQSWMNQKLGFTSNKYADWESGKTNIKWLDFIQVCQILNKPIQQAAQKHFGYTQEIADSANLIQHLLSSKNQNELGKILGCSRDQVQRMLSGKTSLPLSLALKAMIESSFDELFFINNLVEIDEIKKYVEKKEKLFQIIKENPWIELLPRLIESPHINKELNNIAQLISIIGNIDKSKAIEMIEVIEELGYIEIKNNLLTRNLRFLDTSSAQNPIEIRKFWNDKGITYLGDPQRSDKTPYAGYKIFSCDEKSLPIIKKAYMDFYHSIDQTLKTSPEGDQRSIYLLNLQLFDVMDMFNLNNEGQRI